MYAIWLMEYIVVLLSVIVCVFNASYLVHLGECCKLLFVLLTLYYRCTHADYHVRLVNGVHNSTVYSGRVEVVVDGEWGTVCDDYWDTNDASVVCRQLGYPVVQRVYSSAHFGRGTGMIWLDDLRCSGEEEGLNDCMHRGIGQHNCGHSEDAGVACSSGENTCMVVHAHFNMFSMLCIYV